MCYFVAVHEPNPPQATSAPGAAPLLFGTTALLSAFLLFVVELLVGKHLLPWFGGAPAVWITCLLFFQFILLLGYAYAHLLIRLAPARAQAVIHGALLLASLGVLVLHWLSWGSPLLPPASYRPQPDADPTWSILRTLSASIGVPFLALSATAPLVQAWFARAHPGTSPYRLYALSNLGSLVGLICYPFVLEPLLALPPQAALWGALFMPFALACALVAVRAWRAPETQAECFETDDDMPPSWTRRALWLALSTATCALLLAVTNQICQEITVIPLLWVLPLVIYLGTFVVCFRGERSSPRALVQPLLLLGAALTCVVLYHDIDVPVLLQIGAFTLTLLGACLACHGELYRLRPAARHLTSYYLMISIGGALGGALVAVVAPRVFNGLWELHGALLACAVLVVFAMLADRESWLRRGILWPALATLAVAVGVAAWLIGSAMLKASAVGLGGGFGGRGPTLAVASLAVVALLAWRLRAYMRQPRLLATLCLGLALAALSMTLRSHITALTSSVRLAARDFFGTLRVMEMARDDEEEHAFWLLHGRIVHGFQYAAPNYRGIPTSYFSEGSGISLAIRHHPKRMATPTAPLRVGVLGLGIGTIAAHCREGDSLRFYEISPAVVRVATVETEYFTYIKDSAARVEVALGDARVALEGELARGERQRFDVLAADAFSSGAVPAHLLTREALTLYLEHLAAPDSILAINVSNHSLDIAQVVWRLASELRLHGVAVENQRSLDDVAWHAVWILLSRDRAALRAPEIVAAATLAPPETAHFPLWTDQYSSLVPILRARAWQLAAR